MSRFTLLIFMLSCSCILSIFWNKDTFSLNNSFFQAFVEAATTKQREIRSVGIRSETLHDIDAGPVPKAERCFMINGWRWHTKSVINDLNRFQKAVSNVAKNKSGDENKQKRLLVDSFDFVFGFNWKALRKIETKIFFPWLRHLLPKRASVLVDNVIFEHKTIEQLVSRLEQLCSTKQLQDLRVTEIENIVSSLKKSALKIQSEQESLFVPYIAAYVTRKEQDVFNWKVVNTLGMLESQIHLVSIHETIKNDPKEMAIFLSSLPWFARKLLPVWKRTLYLPRAKSFFDEL